MAALGTSIDAVGFVVNDSGHMRAVESAFEQSGHRVAVVLDSVTLLLSLMMMILNALFSRHYLCTIGEDVRYLSDDECGGGHVSDWAAAFWACLPPSVGLEPLGKALFLG